MFFLVTKIRCRDEEKLVEKKEKMRSGTKERTEKKTS